MIEKIEEFGGNICKHNLCVTSIIEEDGLDPDDPSIPEMAKQVYQQRGRHCALAVCFLMGGKSDK